MLKVLLIIFILIPFSIWLGTMIANLVSLFLMFAAVAIGGFIHNLFRGKKEKKWQAPTYISVIQYIIIYGLVFSVYANVLGQYISFLHFISTIGGVLQYIFISLLAIDVMTLIVLATIHGSFEIIDD